MGFFKSLPSKTLRMRTELRGQGKDLTLNVWMNVLIQYIIE
jgi:hypothetical protein